MHKPFVNYNGGKSASGTYQKIINVIPPHNLYFELFAGNGSIYRHKLKSLFSILNDIDYEVYKAWSVLNLPGTILLNLDAQAILIMFSEMSGILKKFDVNPYFYLDPPYLFSTRKQKGKLYKHEYSEDDHIKLLSIIKDFPFPLSISCYPNKLYCDQLTGWNKIEFNSTTHSGSRIEVLYFNYPVPETLHDYQFIGSDFKDRYRLKLYSKNLIGKFNRLDTIEQNFLLTTLFRNFPSSGIIQENLNASDTLNGQSISSINQLADKLNT